MSKSTKAKWEEELKKLQILIPDGTLKNCIVYHEAMPNFMKEVISQTEQEVKERILQLLPKIEAETSL
jgi:hypothetical protein